MMGISDPNSVNELINPSQKFLDLLNQSNHDFDKMMSDSQSNETSSNKFLHLEGLRYKFETEDETSYKPTTIDANSSTLDEAETLDSVAAESKELIQTAPVFLNVSPSPASAFLAQLPQHLTSFINRFVEIIQQYRSINGQTSEIRAKFPSMNLDVVFSNIDVDEPMKIKLFLGSDSLQDLFKSNEDKLHLFLEKKLETNVDLELIFESYEDSQTSNEFFEKETEDQSDNQQEDDLEENVG